MISVVIPAYDEAARIAPTLARLARELAGVAHEVIVVDDGSRDRTRAVVERFATVRLLALPRHRGKGAATRAGVLASRGDEVLCTDADLAVPLAELPRLRAALAAGADLAIGSRARTRAAPLLRRVESRVFRGVVRALGVDVGGVRDTQCGFKLFRGEVARRLFAELRLDGLAFDVELLARARARYRVAEVTVRCVHVAGSRVRPLVDPLCMLRDLIRLRTG